MVEYPAGSASPSGAAVPMFIVLMAVVATMFVPEVAVAKRSAAMPSAALVVF
jgi:hypothetical protein